MQHSEGCQQRLMYQHQTASFPHLLFWSSAAYIIARLGLFGIAMRSTAMGQNGLYLLACM